MPREGRGNGNNRSSTVISNKRDQAGKTEVKAYNHFLPKRIYSRYEVSSGGH